MDFSHTEERRMLAETVRRVLADSYPIDERHRATAGPEGFSRKRWAEFAELGLIGALFREADGGFGGEGHDIAVLFEALGEGLVVEPFLATLIAGSLIAESGSKDQRALLEPVIGGESLFAFAHSEPDSRYDLSRVSTSAAQQASGGWILNGRKSVVLNGDAADRLVVSARTGGAIDDEAGIGLFLVDANSAGLDVRGYPTVDGLHAAEIDMTDVRVGADALLGSENGAYPAIEAAVGRGLLALSSEALGAMERAKDMTVDYFKTRTQFGKPIGSFQALQHRMVDLLIEIEQMRSSVINAADRLNGDRVTREWALSAAKNLAGRAGRKVAEEVIQMSGGIAMTWDYAVPHYAKRIVMIDHQLGDADHHLERCAKLSLSD